MFCTTATPCKYNYQKWRDPSLSCCRPQPLKSIEISVLLGGGQLSLDPLDNVFFEKVLQTKLSCSVRAIYMKLSLWLIAHIWLQLHRKLLFIIPVLLPNLEPPQPFGILDEQHRFNGVGSPTTHLRNFCFLLLLLHRRPQNLSNNLQSMLSSTCFFWTLLRFCIFIISSLCLKFAA